MQKPILIVTALPLEFKAVRAFLSDVKDVRNEETGAIYEVGTFAFGEQRYQVALVEAGQGNIAAAHETERAVAFFKPQYLFFVGIAGGVKDVELGDVVASTKVMGYESGKAEEVFKPRFDSSPAAYPLEQIARSVSRGDDWLRRVPPQSGMPRSFIGPIAAGEKVVASTCSVEYARLKEYCSDALAVEMEGAGFFQALRPRQVEGIVVRGISDLIDKKSDADAAGSQPLAASNAAAFAFEMMTKLVTDQTDSGEQRPAVSPRIDPQTKEAVLELLVSLYPQGPEENNIWKRAGGDVTILVNLASRHSQWYNALEKLSLGGGGNITWMSLLKEVMKDFPQNLPVRQILGSL